MAAKRCAIKTYPSDLLNISSVDARLWAVQFQHCERNREDLLEVVSTANRLNSNKSTQSPGFLAFFVDGESAEAYVSPTLRQAVGYSS